MVDAASGRPVIADVLLTADGEGSADEPPRSARSDAGGRFRIDGVPLGSWIAEPSAPGYVASDAVVFTAGAPSWRGRSRVP